MKEIITFCCKSLNIFVKKLCFCVFSNYEAAMKEKKQVSKKIKIIHQISFFWTWQKIFENLIFDMQEGAL